MAGGDQHREPGLAQGLHHEACRFAGHVVMFEEVAAAGDQIDLGLAGPFDDALEGAPKILAASVRTSTVEALTGEGSVEMQVSEMEQAKGHKSPVITRILPGAMA